MAPKLGGDWEALAPTACDPVRGQRVSFHNPSGCMGGVERPKEYWEPCPGAAWCLLNFCLSSFSNMNGVFKCVELAGFGGEFMMNMIV